MSGIAQNGVTPPSPIGVDRIPNSMTALSITAATLIKPAPGRVARISVLVAGTTPGAVNDAAALADVAAGNQVYVVPNTVNVFDVDWPCLNGIVVTPGTGQTLAVAYY